MANVTSKEMAPIFLIMQDRQQCREMADGVREAGYEVTEYQTGREFLIDKRNHTCGTVIAEFRLYGMLGDELVKELASESETFPVVLIATTYDVPRVIKTGVDFIVPGPSLEALLEAIDRTETPEVFDEDSLRWGFERLSPGESKVLDGVLAGKGSREIALDLGLSHKTVEAHQPCHAGSLYVDGIFPEGDRGANLIPTKQGRNLHALWDGLLGGRYDAGDIARRAKEIKAVKESWKSAEAAGKALEPLEWLRESSEFGKSYVYTPEVLSAVEAAQRSGAEKVETVDLPETYLKAAGTLAQHRAAFASHRLATVLSKDLAE